jgi:CBS domain-containing protein
MAVAHILRQKGSDVVTVSPSDSVHTIVSMLASHRIGAVVVVDVKGAIAGIVSERDIVRAMASDPAGVTNKTAKDIMTAKVMTCEPDDSEAELMQLMTENRIRHLPVVADGRLAGMISIGDVVKLRMESIEREAEEMKTYIASAG